jgi:hypothetical protein
MGRRLQNLILTGRFQSMDWEGHSVSDELARSRHSGTGKTRGLECKSDIEQTDTISTETAGVHSWTTSSLSSKVVGPSMTSGR